MKNKGRPPVGHTSGSIAKKKPGPALANIGEALALHQKGRLDEARQMYLKIIERDPQHFDAQHLLGVIALQQGQVDTAIEKLLAAIAVRESSAPAHSNLGSALVQRGRLDEALNRYERAVQLQPDYFDAEYNRGILLQRMGRYDAAIESLSRAIALQPTHRGARLGLADARRRAGRFDEAVTGYLEVLATAPQDSHACFGLGTALRALKRHAEALGHLERATQFKPDYVEAWINRGNCLRDLGRSEEAVACYDTALELDPRSARALTNRGAALNDLQRLPASIRSIEQALALDPSDAEAHWNFALGLLQLGRFEEGWREHEWRWRHQGFGDFKSKRPFEQPLWLGEQPLQGRTILLHAEQGLGDTIQFCRYAALVKALGATVILEVQRPLLRLLAQVAGADRVIARGDALPPFDCHCPLLSLPLALRTRPDTIPAAPRYLDTSAPIVERWRDRLVPAARPRVGLVWSGNPKHANDRNRSVPLSEFVQMLPPGLDYVCLHKEIRPADRERLASEPQIRVVSDELQDFTDTAALCEQLDGVVSVDTSVAHLAAALGRPVEMLLPFNSDWRWLLDRSDSPWYPTMTLHRQTQARDWTAPMAALRAKLTALAQRPR